MKTILATILSAAFAGAAFAQVPSLINYQGRLTDANGDPVTGSKNFAISIYDAATSGTLLYTETIGAVTLDDNGVYSFQFGGSGTSNTLVTETVATTNGTSTTFQKVLANSPVVANSVSVSDGTYTWSQSAGSSNEDQFGVAYSTSLRRITANYYNGAPAAGRTITATYRYGTSGITGALSNGAEHWMAVSVDGTTQAVRQRVLAVPFAMYAENSENAENAENAVTAQQALVSQQAEYSSLAAGLITQNRIWRPEALVGTSTTYNAGSTLPFTPYPPGVYGVGLTQRDAGIPITFKSIKNIDFDINIPFQNPSSSSTAGFKIIRYRADIGEQVVTEYTRTSTLFSNGRITTSHPVNIAIDSTFIYKLRVEVDRAYDYQGNGVNVSVNDVVLHVTE